MSKYIFGRPIGKLIHGGDYNPEQWLDRPDILKADIELMKKAGINEATLGVFSWSVYEPREGEFHFEWLKDTMDRLYENEIYSIVATPSGARPAWMDLKYPEVMRVDGMGIRNRHGMRHNHCLSSKVFREKTGIIDRKLAESIGSHPGLLMWHISNEFGGECFCDNCKNRFREYLRAKFNDDIEELNRQWWTTFWSARYESFDEIEPPYDNGQRAVMGLNIEWKRFTTWNFADFAACEIDTVRKYSGRCDIPVTTNMMKQYDGIDYRVLAKQIDTISWDSYPEFHNDRESYADTMRESAFDHALMRGLKRGQPFMLMESTPGVVNWMEYNKLRRPGVHIQFSLQALASGSDTVQYFQFRKSRGSAEQFHGGVVDHAGTDDTRVFREVARTGAMMNELSDLEGTLWDAKAAVLFDWDNWWAIEGTGGFAKTTRNYPQTCIGYWKMLSELGVEADVISAEDPFDGYSLIIAPMMFLLREEAADKIKEYVSCGGTILGTYMMGYINENCLCHLGGFPGAGLSDVFGIVSEEIDTLYPTDTNAIHITDDRFGKSDWTVKDYAEVIKVKDANIIGIYTQDYYRDLAALTYKEYGKGVAYYQAARSNPEDIREFLRAILDTAGIEAKDVPKGIEYHRRRDDEKSYDFYLNISEDTITIEGFELAPKESLVVRTGADGSVRHLRVTV